MRPRFFSTSRDASIDGAREQVLRHEHQRALRALLQRPLLTSEGPTAEAFGLVRRHAEALRGWLTTNTGWTLHVAGEVARLRKTPADPGDATLLALTDLYDWFAHRGASPAPFSVSGRLAEVPYEGTRVWELTLMEPQGLITAPDFAKPQGTGSRERRSFEHRREFQPKDLTVPGQRAEELALSILEKEFPAPKYMCLWRNQFLDSERIEIREMKIIADIDVWDVNAGIPKQFVEVKSQKLVGASARPIFHLSSAEWRSYQKARDAGIAYELWLFQYREVDDLKNASEKVTWTVYNELLESWFDPESYLVTPPGGTRKSRKVLKPNRTESSIA